MSKFKIASIGSVSRATFRPEDLIESFCEELRFLGHRSTVLSSIEKRFQRAMNNGDNDNYFESEDSFFDIESLESMLNQHCMPFVYFGGHQGDSSDFGFWIDFESLEYEIEDEELVNYDDIPPNYRGLVVEINERGNTSLYEKKYKTKDDLTEIWAAV